MKRVLVAAGSLISQNGRGTMQLADEAERRKARSIALLRAEGIPTIEHLPAVEGVSGSKRRNKQEVTQRAIALAIVAVKGETADFALSQSLIKQFKANEFFTPNEQRFMDDREPTEQDLITYAWRYEAVHVLLWSLAVVQDLGRPDHICDVPHLANILRELGTDGLMRHAELRSPAELLDAADLIYRYHWAVTSARIAGEEPPAALNKGVVHERHYALNWLIGYKGQNWDDVSTDT